MWFGHFVINSLNFHPFLFQQGAVTGAWSGLALCMAATIGNYVEKPHQAVLNTTVENCHLFVGNITIKPIPTDP